MEEIGSVLIVVSIPFSYAMLFKPTEKNYTVLSHIRQGKIKTTFFS